MGSSDMNFDITKNIKLIEMLKGQLLSGVADLFNNLAEDNPDVGERSDVLSDLLVITYLLSNRLGLSYNTLDMKAINKLKIGILEENDNLHNDLVALLRHIYRNQN